MNAQWRPAEHYVHTGTVVIVPARIAALFTERLGLGAKLRASVRGQDPELDSILVALGVASAAWRSTAIGTATTAPPEEDPQLDQWCGTAEAAEQLGKSERGIRKMILEKRLPAERIGRAYRIRRTDIEHARAA